MNPSLLSDLIARERTRRQKLHDAAVKTVTQPTFTRTSGQAPVTPRSEHAGTVNGSYIAVFGYCTFTDDDDIPAYVFG